MAHPDKRRLENVDGLFYVDSTCIDCDTCRWLAPETFHAVGDQSAVHAQPASQAARKQALQALIACPTASIGTTEPLPEMAAARREFPVPIESNVFYCGYHSEKSFGAASYFIQRPEGNILIDSPRQAAPLWDRLEAMGGVRTLFLTHADDVAEHEALRERFGCERVIHAADAHGNLRQAERVLRGTDPIPWDDQLTVIPVPGHTRGSVCVLYAQRYLFTGDHLAYSHRRQHLYAFRDACWYSWEAQIASMRKLASYPFAWVLPGHGRRYCSEGDAMRAQMQRCVDWMEGK
jgi:glyoxylase-like metal-dependent hydrolase (beta-lactamase superfamily II)/ferredoxin